MARHADRAGYDAVWVGDSIVAKPRLEPLTTLAYLAGITSRVRLGTAVLLPALRHPVVLAHQIANVDQISRGRVVLGLGVGWSLPSAEREWTACGADHKRQDCEHEEITLPGCGLAARGPCSAPLVFIHMSFAPAGSPEWRRSVRQSLDWPTGGFG